MSLRVFLQEDPRVIALASERHVMVFRYNRTRQRRKTSAASSPAVGSDAVLGVPNQQAATPKCAVEFTALENCDLSSYRLVRASGIHGTLGLINIDADVYLCVINAAIKVATVRPDEHVQKILSVEFCQCSCLCPSAVSWHAHC